jgi:hypothetical protein
MEMMSSGQFIGRVISLRTGELHAILLENIAPGHLLPVEPAVALTVRSKLAKHGSVDDVLVLLPCGAHFRD